MNKQTLSNGAAALFIASAWAVFLAFMVASTVGGASSVMDAVERSLVAVLLVAGAAFGFWAYLAVRSESQVARTRSLVLSPVRVVSQPRARRPRR